MEYGRYGTLEGQGHDIDQAVVGPVLEAFFAGGAGKGSIHTQDGLRPGHGRAVRRHRMALLKETARARRTTMN